VPDATLVVVVWRVHALSAPAWRCLFARWRRGRRFVRQRDVGQRARQFAGQDRAVVARSSTCACVDGPRRAPRPV